MARSSNGKMRRSERRDAGSSPACASLIGINTEVIRLDEGPVLKTGGARRL